MIELKGYQTRALKSLSDFLKQCAREGKPEEAFRAVLADNGSPSQPYLTVQAEGLPAAMPYVCLRVPTGGGKTLMACHAVGVVLSEYLRAERGVVLWLVPSTAILNQTADALRDVKHPYRQALASACGAVEVLTIEEALRVSRAAADGATIVIVATIQSFKTADPASRRVYGQNGYFSEHLENVPADRLKDLLPGPDGKPRPSLINMLRLRRPIVIVDEAHNARSDLSFSALGDVRPACIVEFTATPAREKHPSNVLHQVSAAELKAADMAKLPVRVVTRHPGQSDQLLAQAFEARSNLEKLAAIEGQKTGEYIRPILLLQAESVAACEPLREKLIQDLGAKADEIKISVGGHDELEDAGDLSSPKSPVRHVITVQRLREGWDCPFAYVLCSLRETRSATAIEQIVGRILRLPGARAKTQPELNCAYAFSVSPSIADVLAELRDALVANGFTRAEAGRIVVSEVQAALPLGLERKTTSVAPKDVDRREAEARNAALDGKAYVDADSGVVTIFAPLEDAELKGLEACVTTPAAKAALRALASRPPTPYERGADFRVPLLCVRENGSLFELDGGYLLDRPWKLGEKDASLPESYNPLKPPSARSGSLDIGATGDPTAYMAREGEEDFTTALHQQVFALVGREDWTPEKLVAWLDWNIEHRDILESESAAFLGNAVRGLVSRRGIKDIGALARDRFRLRDELERRIDEHRQSEKKTAFQALLLPESPLAVSDERALNFKTLGYEPSRLYEGSFEFKRHYFGPRPGELEERTADGKLKEEFRCAQFLDQLPETEFWIRNLPKKPGSFRLQTVDGLFYPDFLVQLKDGRVLVVEYKGAHLLPGAQQKRDVGAVWAKRSGGKCLFVMPTDGDFSVIRAALA